MSNIQSRRPRSQDEIKAEAQMKEAMAELMKLCLENDQLVFEIGSLLLLLGGTARNYRHKTERGGGATI